MTDPGLLMGTAGLYHDGVYGQFLHTDGLGQANIQIKGMYAWSWVKTSSIYNDSNSLLKIGGNSQTVAGNRIEMAWGSFTATTGQNNAVVIMPTYNQTSGDAANTDLLINRTETAIGSGDHFLIDAQVGGASKFSVDNAGNVAVRTIANIVDNWRMDTITLEGDSTFSIKWSTTSSYVGTKDIGLARYNSGTASFIDITDGSTGQGRLRVGAGDATDPGLIIGANAAGFYESASNVIDAVVSGSARWYFNASEIKSRTNYGARIGLAAASSTDPRFSFTADQTTGIGRAAASELSLIAGATEIARCLKDGSSNPVLRAASVFSMLERSSDPAKPADGETIIWMSDGTGLGADGDVVIASTVGSTTNYSILFDHSAGTTWT